MFTLTHTVTAVTASLLGAGTDIIIGSPVGGRTEHGLENLIGYFVNTLPLRHHLHPTDTITDLLTTTHHTVLDGLAHQHAP
ncbi:condensation domain-containing protein, partial [Rhodococcoides fascians]|uniref:condensation domain-containing protein n=1 Tax=Rhodococcoides fascians TaxID=1828 RepID=UPI001E4E5201